MARARRATQNNGRITSQKNTATGEEINYGYDSLQRLISAVTTGPQWGLSFSYDGFGNRIAQGLTKGAAPTFSAAADPATNRLIGQGYDNNGNVTGTAGGSFSYDVENRLIESWDMAAGSMQYTYDPANKRVWRQWQSSPSQKADEYHLFGACEEEIGVYKWVSFGIDATTYAYFAGRRVVRYGITSNRYYSPDRVGSDMSGSYYPYGEEKQVTAHNEYKFATYFREASGLDYADQRYYSSVQGRFMTADPGPYDPATPQSWNRYNYAWNDPVNLNDPNGKLPMNVVFDGFACVAGGFFAPGGAIDASSNCPPGYIMIAGGTGTGESKSLLQQISNAFDPLRGIITDWDYANQYGTSFNLLFTSSTGSEVFTLNLSQVRNLASFAADFAAAVNNRKINNEKEDCERLRDGIKLSKELKIAGTAVAAAAALVNLFAPNPFSTPVAVVAGIGGAAGAVSEFVLQEIYNAKDCDKVLEKAK